MAVGLLNYYQDEDLVWSRDEDELGELTLKPFIKSMIYRL